MSLSGIAGLSELIVSDHAMFFGIFHEDIGN